MKKIYIVGAHCSGKSTIARYISQKYNLSFIPEVARQILAERELQLDSLRADIETVNDYQKSIFFRQLEEEKKYQEFVSDRSFDCLAYAAQHSTIFSELVSSKELQEYLSLLRERSSFIFFVRPCKATLKQDGVRETLNWEGIIAIDAQIKLLLELWNLRYFQINTENMQERIRLIDAVLG